MKSYTREIGFALTVIICSTLQARGVSKIDRPANAATCSVHDEAMRILNSIHKTKYQHKPDIDEKKGAYYCDCSGFVGYVLSRTVSKEDANGPLHNARKWPTAMEYEKFFAAAPANRAGDGRWQ